MLSTKLLFTVFATLFIGQVLAVPGVHNFQSRSPTSSIAIRSLIERKCPACPECPDLLRKRCPNCKPGESYQCKRLLDFLPDAPGLQPFSTPRSLAVRDASSDDLEIAGLLDGLLGGLLGGIGGGLLDGILNGLLDGLLDGLLKGILDGGLLSAVLSIVLGLLGITDILGNVNLESVLDLTILAGVLNLVIGSNLDVFVDGYDLSVFTKEQLEALERAFGCKCVKPGSDLTLKPLKELVDEIVRVCPSPLKVKCYPHPKTADLVTCRCE